MYLSIGKVDAKRAMETERMKTAGLSGYMSS